MKKLSNDTTSALTAIAFLIFAAVVFVILGINGVNLDDHSVTTSEFSVSCFSVTGGGEPVEIDCP